MRIAALLVALFTLIASTAGIISPDSMMVLRRSYYTPSGLSWPAQFASPWDSC